MGATPFLGYTVEPNGCSRWAGPGALALLKNTLNRGACRSALAR
ncbi:hypothetical protein DO66_6093 [Burkholderia pseudomallei]|nr:hypothetical protein DO66_6093 [Burkholderia pseudomallei]